MSTITKEWLQQKIADMEAARDEIPFGLDEDDSNTLAALRIALASLEANSRKLFTCSACGAEGLDEPLESKCHCCIDGAHWVESRIYTAPPAPVSDSLLSELLDIAKRAADEADECARAEFSDDSMEHSAAIADWERRAVMLQGADGNSPVIPDGWVMVPVEPTEDMIVNGFESEPDESFSDEKEWEAYDAMSGCQQAAHRAKLCWAAMIATAPKV